MPKNPFTNSNMKSQKCHSISQSRTRRVIRCICSKNEVYKYVTSTIYGTNKVSEVQSGKFLYYARDADNKFLVPLSSIVSIIDPTEQYENIVNQFLDYMATYPNAVNRFHASDNILRANTDASYMTEIQACSRAAGYFFLKSVWHSLCKLQHFQNKLPPLQQKQKPGGVF